MSDRVRIGFVGVGNMGQCAHLKNYASLLECEVAAIAEVRPELARKVAARYAIPAVYASPADMLAKEQLDGLVAPQPFNRHGQILPELYEAGLPILTEKPLAASLEVGEKLLRALEARAANSPCAWHMVGYHKRSDPATMWARREIDRLKETGELGPLRYVRISMPAGDWVAGGFNDLISSSETLPDAAYDPPAADMDDATYREYVSFVNYYIHQVNLLRHLLGDPYKVSYADPSGVLLAVQSDSGVAGTIEMSPYNTTVDWQESALVAFVHGYVRLELPAPLASNRPGRVEVYYDPGKTEPRTVVPQLPWVHAMRQQAANFVSAIKGEMAPMCQAAEALEDLSVARDYIRLRYG